MRNKRITKKQEFNNTMESVNSALLRIIELKEEEKEIVSKLNEAKKYVKKNMKELEKDVILSPYDDKMNIKASRYESRKVVYDESIFKYLKSRKLLSSACKIVIDDDKIEDLYNKDIITADEIAKYAKLKVSECFKVSLTKIF